MIVLEADLERMGAYAWGWEWGDQFVIYWTREDYSRWVQIYEECQAELASHRLRYLPAHRKAFEEERREAVAMRSYLRKESG